MNHQPDSQLRSLVSQQTNVLQFPPAPTEPTGALPERLKLSVRTISLLTHEQLNNLENNYRRMNKTSGGKWTLQQVLEEKKCRQADENDAESLVRVIVENCRRNSDTRTTYADVHRAIYPNEKWTGDSSKNKVMRALRNVVAHCIANGLPIITSLVVQEKSRKLTPGAIENIYKTCREFDFDVGLNTFNFVARQIALSRTFVRVLH